MRWQMQVLTLLQKASSRLQEWQHTERSEMITYQIAMRLAVLEKEAREHTPDKVLVETDQVKLVPEMSSDKIACPIQSRVAEA